MSVEGGVVGGVWGGTRGVVVVPICIVGGGLCVESVLISGAMRLGMHVTGGKEGRTNKLGVWKCGGLGLEKRL